VPADELSIARKRHVAFENPGAHSRGGNVRLARVLGKLQRRTAVRDREFSPLERPRRTLHQALLERSRIHVVDEKQWPGAELHRRELRSGRPVRACRDPERQQECTRRYTAHPKYRRSARVHA
jgi:hypothetical protein